MISILFPLTTLSKLGEVIQILVSVEVKSQRKDIKVAETHAILSCVKLEEIV